MIKIKESDLPCLGIGWNSGNVYHVSKAGEDFVIVDASGLTFKTSSFIVATDVVTLAPKGTTFTITQE